MPKLLRFPVFGGVEVQRAIPGLKGETYSDTCYAQLATVLADSEQEAIEVVKENRAQLDSFSMCGVGMDLEGNRYAHFYHSIQDMEECNPEKDEVFVAKVDLSAIRHPQFPRLLKQELMRD